MLKIAIWDTKVCENSAKVWQDFGKILTRFLPKEGPPAEAHIRDGLHAAEAPEEDGGRAEQEVEDVLAEALHETHDTAQNLRIRPYLSSVPVGSVKPFFEKRKKKPL